MSRRVRNPSDPDGEGIRGHGTSSEISRGIATEQECTRLQLHAGDEVYRIHRVRRREGLATLVEEVVLPAALFPGLPDAKGIADSMTNLAQHYGIQLGKGEERISTVMLSAALAEVFGVAVGLPALLMDRVVLLRDGRPVEWCRAHAVSSDR